MANKPSKRLSTSALAKQLEMPVKHIFGLLRDYGWIKRVGDSWKLTAKGEFEGGSYRQTERFGEYITWPLTLTEHAMLTAAVKNHTLSASELGRGWGIPGRMMNRLLAELGWIKQTVKGWELSSVGASHGGIEYENDDNGSLYCVWPETVKENAALVNLLALLRLHSADDLFTEFQGIDGHASTNDGLKRICDWLYLMNLAHACNRALDDSVDKKVGGGLKADFYLPASRLYIEYWGEATPAELALKMQKKTYFEERQLTVIELHQEDIGQLDHVLAKALLENGVKVY